MKNWGFHGLNKSGTPAGWQVACWPIPGRAFFENWKSPKLQLCIMNIVGNSCSFGRNTWNSLISRNFPHLFPFRITGAAPPQIQGVNWVDIEVKLPSVLLGLLSLYTNLHFIGSTLKMVAKYQHTYTQMTNLSWNHLCLRFVDVFNNQPIPPLPSVHQYVLYQMVKPP